MTQKSMPFSDYEIFNIGTSGMIVHQGAKNSLWKSPESIILGKGDIFVSS